MKRHALALTFGVLLLTTGCSTIRPVEIRSVPPGATVVIDDLEKGTSPYTHEFDFCLLYTSPSPRDRTRSRMPSSA